MPPVGIYFAAALVTARWFIGLHWRISGASFVRGMKGADDPLTEGPPS